MFIKHLILTKDDEIIRQIDFQKGLNLIVDNTSNTVTDSGNNVGKTTVLRLVDYCFGGKGKNVYTDPEFKDRNKSPIELFLTQNDVRVTLVLKEDLLDENSKEIKITRNFLAKAKHVYTVNGEKIKIKDVQMELKKRVFGSDNRKPTFRQLIAKNIRDEGNRLTNTVKVLTPFDSIAEYEALYLFWLGIEPDTNELKQSLLRKKKLEETVLDRLLSGTSLATIEQALIIVNSNIEELESKKSRFGIDSDYEDRLDQLNATKRLIVTKSSRITALEVRLSLIEQTRSELLSEMSNVDVEEIRVIYQEAKSLIPTLQKSFEDTLSFHNQMVENKLAFVSGELPKLEQKLKKSVEQKNELLEKELELTNRLDKSGFMEELQGIMSSLNVEHEKKGALEQQKQAIEQSENELASIISELERIDEGVYSMDEEIKAKVAKLNQYFTDLSRKLYGEQFLISPEKHENGYQLEISSLDGNLGTGKKKGQMAAFDLAYIQFADAQGIKCLHFIMQDQIENVHGNQIIGILDSVLPKINCQYILPVLRDKLPANIDVDKYQVLSLSQTDKLFKLS